MGVGVLIPQKPHCCLELSCHACCFVALCLRPPLNAQPTVINVMSTIFCNSRTQSLPYPNVYAYSFRLLRTWRHCCVARRSHRGSRVWLGLRNRSNGIAGRRAAQRWLQPAHSICPTIRSLRARLLGCFGVSHRGRLRYFDTEKDCYRGRHAPSLG